MDCLRRPNTRRVARAAKVSDVLNDGDALELSLADEVQIETSHPLDGFGDRDTVVSAQLCRRRSGVTRWSSGWEVGRWLAVDSQ